MFKGDVTDIPEELVEIFKIDLSLAGRVASAYVNKIKGKQYKNDKEFRNSIDKILKGEEGTLGE